MLKAIVFDMDETLLHINLQAFFAVMVRDEVRLIADIGRCSTFDASIAYARGLLKINQVGREGSRTNLEVFHELVREGCGVDLSDPVVGAVLEFYEREILPHKNGRLIHAAPMPGARETLEAVLARGLDIALLTNPSCTQAAVACRMNWGGLSDVPFKLITTMENSHHCKPDARYYTESLAVLGVTPEETLMVGNDPKRDFPDTDCGLKTAYVGRGHDRRALWNGSMTELAENLDAVISLFED